MTLTYSHHAVVDVMIVWSLKLYHDLYYVWNIKLNWPTWYPLSNFSFSATLRATNSRWPRSWNTCLFKHIMLLNQWVSKGTQLYIINKNIKIRRKTKQIFHLVKKITMLNYDWQSAWQGKRWTVTDRKQSARQGFCLRNNLWNRSSICLKYVTLSSLNQMLQLAKVLPDLYHRTGQRKSMRKADTTNIKEYMTRYPQMQKKPFWLHLLIRNLKDRLYTV